MKTRLYLMVLLAVLLGWSEASASWWLVGETVATSAECSTPQDGDEMNEGFLGAGYELGAAWTETVGTGGTVDEDHTLTGSGWETSSCSEGLLTAVTTSGTATYTEWDRGSTIPSSTDITITFEFMIDSATFPGDYNTMAILQWDTDTDTGTGVADLNFRRGSGGQLALSASHDANSADISISTGVKYSVLLYLDGTPANSYIQLDGGSEISFTPKTAAGQYLRVGPSQGLGSDEAVQIQWGEVHLDTP